MPKFALNLPIALTSAFIAVSLTLIVIKRATRKVYEKVGIVNKLIFYPVKACQGIEVNELEITSTGAKLGLFHDRQYCVIDANMNMINLTTAPRLALIKTQINGNILTLRTDENNKINIIFKEHLTIEDNIFTFTLFNSKPKGIDCGEEVAEWLSNYLNIKGVRLVQHVPELELANSRTKNKRSKQIESHYKKMYQNKSSLMIATESSLNDLNDKIIKLSGHAQIVTMDRFKPNVVVSGSKPWDEDAWLYVQLGNEPQMFQAMPCTRCIQTNINKIDASKGIEPMRTLETFRQTKNKNDIKRFGGAPLFGAVFGIDKTGIVRIGDPVYAIRVDLV